MPEMSKKSGKGIFRFVPEADPRLKFNGVRFSLPVRRLWLERRLEREERGIRRTVSVLEGADVGV